MAMASVALLLLTSMSLPFCLTTAPTPDPVLPNASKNIFDVRSNGAVGDGKTDDTKAFKAAWESACNQTDQAKILVPMGYSFLLQPISFSGPCQNDVIFQVEGTIVANENPKSPSGNDTWIEYIRIDRLTVQGGGLLDGQGEKWWSCESCSRPAALRFRTCTNLNIVGSKGSRLRVENSPFFHIVIDQGCQNVTVDSISIYSPATSPNTDGIHIASKDISVTNSDISNGDDCISMSTGSENIYIDSVKCHDGHGISIGSLGQDVPHDIVKNITVHNCSIASSQNGVRIKTWASGSGSVSDVKFQNIQMDGVLNPIIIDQFYCPDNRCDPEKDSSEVLISNVTYANIKGTYKAVKPPVYFNCSSKAPCTDISIFDMKLVPDTSSSDVPDPVCSNISGCSGEKIEPPVTCLGKKCK